MILSCKTNPRQLSAATREKISTAQKKAHADGRGHNIGQCRWKKEPSYPEKFFIGVIAREFTDKEYVRELWVGRFSIDFAWPSKKLAIEIDGEQHTRFQDNIERDARKDAYLSALGWRVLRVPWTAMYQDPAAWITTAKNFIGPISRFI